MINAKIGASILSWMCPPWNNHEGCHAIEKTAKSGFDLIEILLPNSRDFDPIIVKEHLQKNNLEVVCGMNLSADYHIPSHPKEAIALITWGIEVTKALGSQYLGGVLHSAIGYFSGKPRTKEEEKILFEVWNVVGETALKHNVMIGIEPINRYESYMCTGASETLQLIKDSKAKNIGLHLDTFHMNIEEQSFYQPIIEAGNHLMHIHMTENDRGMLGDGNVNWDDLFKALNEIDFEGRLVLENFSNSIPHMAETVSLWRESPYNAEELAKGSLEFIKKKIKQFNK